MAKEAHVAWNAGICNVIDNRTQHLITWSKSFRRATRKARNLGFNVKVYKGDNAGWPRDAILVFSGSYVLPRVKKAKR